MPKRYNDLNSYLKAAFGCRVQKISIDAGLTCPTVDAAQVRLAVVSADLVLGRDEYAKRFIAAYREAEAAKAQ